MKSNILTETKYAKLLKDVRRIIEQGKQRAAQAASQDLVLTYWDVGRRISAEGLTDHSGYGDSIMVDLAQGLGIDRNTLYQSVAFFRQNKICPRAENLTWSHYRILLNIRDPQERQWYEQKTAEEKLTRDQLVNLIKNEQYEEDTVKGKASRKSKKFKRPKEATYVYKAYVDRVIDGDTLYLRIDLGFQVFKEQRIRLTHIDCPPLDDPKGREAYAYVRDQLARAPFVMIKTNKIDIYGRYLGDVFYSFKTDNKNQIFAQGRYLNQELLEKGFAKQM